MAGTQATQATTATQATEATPGQARPAYKSPFPAYVPPETALIANKDQLDYRGELIKQLVEVDHQISAYRDNIMQTWTTRQLALAGLQNKILTTLLGDQGAFAIADSNRERAKGEVLAAFSAYSKEAAPASMGAGNAAALKHISDATGDLDGHLLNALTDDKANLDAIYNAAQTQPTPEARNAALQKGLFGYLDMQSGITNGGTGAKSNEGTRLNAIRTAMADVPEEEKVDTVIDERSRFASPIVQTLGSDERFAPFVPTYLNQTASKFMDAAGIDKAALAAADARHQKAGDYAKYLMDHIDAIGGHYQVPQQLIDKCNQEIENYKSAIGGDVYALNDLTQSIAAPKEYEEAHRILTRELERQDTAGDPNAQATIKFIKAFNTRAGRDDAFMTWANAMGFRGRGAMDRAVDFAAARPNLAADFADQVKADPSLVTPTATRARTVLKAMGQPVGAIGLRNTFNRNTPVVTPALAHQDLPGRDTIPNHVDLTPTKTETPAANPEAPVAPVIPGMSDMPEGWSPEEEAKFQAWYAPIAQANNLDANPDAPEHHYNYRLAFRAGAMPNGTGHWPSEFKAADHPHRYVNGEDTITGQEAMAVPFDAPSQASQPRNRVETEADGSIVAIHPDGSKTVLVPAPATMPAAPPTLPQDPSQPQVLSLPEENITAPSQAIAARLGPAVTSSDIPGTADPAAEQMRQWMMQRQNQDLRSRLDVFKKLNELGQPSGLDAASNTAGVQ